MLRQVVAAHKSPITNLALEFLLAGMGPLVARQLVTAREASPTLGPFALERPFAGVHALVRLQMARLEVVFTAAGVIALVNPASLQVMAVVAGGHHGTRWWRWRVHTGGGGSGGWQNQVAGGAARLRGQNDALRQLGRDEGEIGGSMDLWPHGFGEIFGRRHSGGGEHGGGWRGRHGRLLHRNHQFTVTRVGVFAEAAPTHLILKRAEHILTGIEFLILCTQIEWSRGARAITVGAHYHTGTWWRRGRRWR